MILLESSRFKDSLLDLLGKDEQEVLHTAPAPEIVNAEGTARRLIWRETARDGATGRRFPMLFMARVLEGRIWAVGVWTEDHIFVLRTGENGRPYFVATQRGLEFSASQVNWIVREGVGFVEIGVAP